MEPFDAFGAEIQTENMLMRIGEYQQEQRREQQRLDIAQQNVILKEQIARRKAEYQSNNDLLSGVWKAVTDKGTPPELAQHLRDFADDYKKTMTRQQAEMLDITVVRGLYSEEDRKLDTFKRIFGDRPNMDLSSVPEPQLIPKMAELKVNQVEYDTRLDNYLTQGMGMDKKKSPALVPITSFLDKENKPHSIFGRRDPSTGMISTVDTGSDMEGDMFVKAAQSGMSPSIMAQNDFVPFPDSKERIVKSGGKVYSMRVGQALTDGSLKTLKIDMGDDDTGSSFKSLQVPSRLMDTLDMMNSAADGGITKEKYGKYGDIINSFKELESIDLKGTDASKSKAFMTALLNKEIASHQKFRDWVIAPVYDKKPSGWFGYYQNDGRYYAFPADTRAQIGVNGKMTTFWYKQKIQGQKGEHFWHDAFGNYMEGLQGKAPGSTVDNKSLQEVPASKVAESGNLENQKSKGPMKTISLGEWLIRDAQKHQAQRTRNITEIHRKSALSSASFKEQLSKGFEQGTEDITSNSYVALLSKLPIQLAEKLMNIQVPMEEE